MRVLIFKKRTLIKTAVCVMLVLFGVICTGIFYGDTQDVFGNNANENMPVCSVATDEKVVALTIDTAFGDDYTEKMLDILKKYNIKATFFVMGMWGEENSAVVDKILADGHEIQNHSMEHIRYTDVSAEEMLADAQAAKEYISSISNSDGNIIRLPYGAYSNEVVETLITKGFIPITWSNDGEDWKEEDAAKVCENVVNNVTGGDIIMLQNNTASGADALENIIIGLKEKDYEFLTVSQMMPGGDIKTDANGKASTFKE